MINKEYIENMLKDKYIKSMPERCSELEELLNKLSYFERKPEEKKRNKEKYCSVCKSVEKHYDSYLNQIEELMGQDNILSTEQLQNFYDTVKPVFQVSKDLFKDTKLRINCVIEKHKLRKLKYSLQGLRKRFSILEEKLKDSTITKEEKEEFNELEYRLYYISR